MAVFKLSLRARIYTLFVVLMTMYVLNFALMMNVKNQTDAAQERINETNTILDLKSQLLLKLTDAETGQRGFILTGKPEYLVPYSVGSEQAQQTLKKLLQLNKKNVAVQHQRLQEVARLIELKLSELAKTIQLYNTGDVQASLDLINSDEGQRYMDEIRAQLRAFKALEMTTLNERQQKLNGLLDTVQIIYLLEFVVFLILMLLLVGLIRRRVTKPLTQLHISAKQLEAQGRFTPVPNVADDEIGSVVKAFNAMAQKIVTQVRELRDLNHQTTQERDTARMESLVDHLTGLFNRRHLSSQLQKLIESSNRYGHPLTLLMIDLDHFKDINDTFGHDSGDRVLIEVANLIHDTIRESDIAVRYSGDEFIIVLDHTDVKDALAKAEWLREQVALTHINELGGSRLSVSIGVATHLPNEDTPESLLKKADEALYRAKQAGRNRSESA